MSGEFDTKYNLLTKLKEKKKCHKIKITRLIV